MDVIATAMVSALGYDVHTACAAARAGLSRAGELPFTLPENDRSPGLAIGHAADLVGGGFERDARLMRLLGAAVRDLVAQLPPDLLALPTLGFYLALPASDREHHGLDLILDEEARPLYLERIGTPGEIDEAARGVKILTGALRMADVPSQLTAAANAVRVSTAGHAAVIGLLQRAHADLDAGRVDLAIVGGVDSLIGPSTLTWLQLTGRLKGAESPAGLSPGEAAALVAVGSPGLSERMATPVRAHIDRVATQVSATQFLAGDAADGFAQSQVVRTLLEKPDGPSEPQWLIVDQNGEMFRASDWGCSLVRLRGAGALPETSAEVWYPASSFGDTGAAAGAVATCLAVEAYERGYAPFPQALVLTSSDGPGRSGCVVSA